MTFASVILGCLIASIPACAFNYFVGGNFPRLLSLNAMSWIGFWIGQIVASWQGWTFLIIGPIIVGIDLLFSFVFIGLGYWLTNFQATGNKKSR